MKTNKLIKSKIVKSSYQNIITHLTLLPTYGTQGDKIVLPHNPVLSVNFLQNFAFNAIEHPKPKKNHYRRALSDKLQIISSVLIFLCILSLLQKTMPPSVRTSRTASVYLLVILKWLACGGNMQQSGVFHKRS